MDARKQTKRQDKRDDARPRPRSPIRLEPSKLLMLNGIEGAKDLSTTIKIGNKPGLKAPMNSDP